MPPDKPAAHASFRPDGDGAAVRVVVVDDNIDAADTFGMLLETLGCEVRTAYTGAGALATARDFGPSLVFLDLGLPDVSGLEVCAQLRLEPVGRDMVICAVTGWGRAADREATARAGFDHHLVKPVEPERLRPLVDQAARARARQGTAPDGRLSSTT